MLATSTLHACLQITQLKTNYSDVLIETFLRFSEKHVLFFIVLTWEAYKKSWGIRKSIRKTDDLNPHDLCQLDF